MDILQWLSNLNKLNSLNTFVLHIIYYCLKQFKTFLKQFFVLIFCYCPLIKYIHYRVFSHLRYNSHVYTSLMLHLHNYTNHEKHIEASPMVVSHQEVPLIADILYVHDAKLHKTHFKCKIHYSSCTMKDDQLIVTYTTLTHAPHLYNVTNSILCTTVAG